MLARRRAWLPAILAAVLVLGAGVGAAGADDTDSDDEGGIPLQVTVRTAVPSPGPTATPTPSPSSTSGTGTGSGSGSGSGGSTPIPTPTPTSDQLQTLPDGQSVGGVLYVSGLTTHYLPSLDPLGGSVRASFTVHNVSGTTVDSTASFELQNIFGRTLSTVSGVTVLRLKPGESRVVAGTLTHPAQWAFTRASFTLHPTSLVAGERLPSVTRDTIVFFVPWLILILLIIAITAYVIRRVARSRPEPPEEEA